MKKPTCFSEKEWIDLRVNHSNIIEHLDKRSPVNIILNDELGDIRWSVAPISDADLWLMSFPTLPEAKYFCNEMGLEIIRIADLNWDYIASGKNLVGEEKDDMWAYLMGEKMFP